MADVWAGGSPNFDERTGTYRNRILPAPKPPTAGQSQVRTVMPPNTGERTIGVGSQTAPTDFSGAFRQVLGTLQPAVQHRQNMVRQQYQDRYMPQMRAQLASSGYLNSDQRFAQERAIQQAMNQDMDNIAAGAQEQAVGNALGFSQLGQSNKYNALNALMNALGMSQRQDQFDRTLPLQVGGLTGFYNPPVTNGSFNTQLEQFLSTLLGMYGAGQ